MQADLRISFASPLVIRGGSNLPEGQELAGMFAYRLVSGHCHVQTGVAGIGEEGTVTMAGIFALAVVTGREKRRAEWVHVAWLAMRVHVGRMRSREGLTSLTSRERRTPPPHPAPGSVKPPPLEETQVRPPPRPRVQAPPRSGRHVTGRGGLWMNGWSSNSGSARRGRSARSAQRPHNATRRPALIRQMKTAELPRRSVILFAATRIASLPGSKSWSGRWHSAGPRGQGTGTDSGG